MPAAPRPLASRPSHVVYGGADRFDAKIVEKLGGLAVAAMDRFGADDAAFGRVLGLEDPRIAAVVAARVRDKLKDDPVESFTIDFEDGYGERSDEEEDADASRAGGEARVLAATEGAPLLGMRLKALSGDTRSRAERTFHLFMKALGPAPEGFSITLAKVSSTAEIQVLVDLLKPYEKATLIDVELMVETPQALLDAGGRIALRDLVAAAKGRCAAVHLGAYDLTASLGAVTGRLDHPLCDTARALMQIALAGTDVGVVDGATTLLPTGDDAAAVHEAWKMHASNVRRALDIGITQGWDLHPAQLPARFGALFAFYRAMRASAAARVERFVERAARATRSGQAFDDMATMRAVLAFFRQGVECGAIDEDETPREALASPYFASYFARP